MGTKIWFIQFDGKKEGPYSIEELKKDRRLTPDTLVWKQGFAEWIPMRFIPELKELFEEDEKLGEGGAEGEGSVTPTSQEEIALSMGQDPQQYLWLIVLALLAIYLVFNMLWTQ